jgi:hypothetical protein
MNYIYTDNLYIFLLAVFLQLVIVFLYKDKGIYRPIILLPSIVLIYIILGNINLFFFQNYFGWYTNIIPKMGNRYAILALIISQLFFLLKRASKSKLNIKNSVICKRRWDKLTYFLFAISLIFNLLNYYQIGGILVIKGGLNGYERFDTLTKLPFPKMLFLSSFLITPLIISLYISKKNRLINSILLFVSFFFAAGLGHRQLLLQPILIAAFFLIFIQKIKGVSILYWIIFLSLIFLFLSLLRGDSSNVALTSYESFLGIEYRDFLRLHQEDFKPLNGESIYPIILNIIPKQIYEIFDLNKDNFRFYSAYFVQELWGNKTGQRVGLWGEFYLNFGNIGILIGFLFISFFTYYLDRILCSNGIPDTKKIFVASYFYVLLLFSIVGSLATIGDNFGTFGLYFLVFYLLSFKVNNLSTSSNYI